MALNLLASKSDPPLAALVVSNLMRSKVCVSVTWGTKTTLTISDTVLDSPVNICRYLARIAPETLLYGNGNLERTEIDHWLVFAYSQLSSPDTFEKAVFSLNQDLGPATFLVGSKYTLADVCVWSILYKSKKWIELMTLENPPVNVVRWYKFIDSLDTVRPLVSKLTELSDLPGSLHNRGVSIPKEKSPKPSETSRSKDDSNKAKDEGKFIELPDAEKGKVVVRFPPEASGYLHIGHAKAALLNQYYKDAYDGKLIMRFDDTNPAKEKVDFEKVILEDLKLLKITPDEYTHTSNYFELMLELCEKLLKQGLAYVDDTDAETMKQEREQRIESKNRSNSVEQNLELWTEMKAGSESGQKCCVRAKIDMSSVNGCMRDPTIYRCKTESHPRTGNKYKVYPTYDFACPIVDSIEGVTHCLRTMEYHDRDEQFYWFIDVLGLRKPHIWEYSRLNMMNTVLSKRKLTWFVDEGYVDSWDDPRFPTVRGVLRHGMTVEGLKQFIIAQGSSRSVVLMEWDKIWSFNKKVIDPIAPRYTSIAIDNVPVLVKGVASEPLEVPVHPKDPNIGKKIIWIGPRILIDREDAGTLKEGENATFINWGNLLIKKINRKDGIIESVEAEPNLQNTDYKKTVKLTWLAETDKAPFVPCVCLYFEHIISKAVLGKDENFKDFINTDTRKEVAMLGDPELKKLKKCDIIQLQRRGFFICDQEYSPPSKYSGREVPVVLIYVPDGRTKEQATSGAPKIAPVMTKSKTVSETASKISSSQLRATPQKQPEIKSTAGSTLDAAEINYLIQAQGDIVRKLKNDKADKDTIGKEVAVLLKLKADFRAAAGIDWKPGVQLPKASAASEPASNSATIPAASISCAIKSSSNQNTPESINSKIVEQGDKVRNLKNQKAGKEVIDAEVKVLLSLKAKFQAATGLDWKPKMIISSANVTGSGDANKSSGGMEELDRKIVEQGEKVRGLKTQKAQKNIIEAEVQILLRLKEEYKKTCGIDWKPKTAPTTSAAAPTMRGLLGEIVAQNLKLDNLKAANAAQNVLDSEKKVLLKFTDGFKTITGKNWGSDSDPAVAFAQMVAVQGDTVRQLKSGGSDKGLLDEQVKKLLKMKADYKTLTGVDYAPSGSDPVRSKSEKPKAKSSPNKNKENIPAASEEGLKKQTRLGLEATKEDNLPEWYSQVITKGELIEYYDVSGCYIYRPWSYAIWEFIKDFFDSEIKKLGVQNCYFPLFVSRTVLEKEKTHIADFAPEVAWVTKSGDSDLAEPIAVRPTSETVMYPAYAKWIQSYRDLPIKLNQWNNVVRWEFKHPQPFLRTREFLWQEGHTAYASSKEAEEEVLTILDLYAQVYTNLLAVPVIKGRKTEKEKFAGGDYTTTVEAFISASGRAIQGATSHHLGQNFSKMFEISYEDPDNQEKKFVFQNSWGITTRTIGVMIMVHADNQGLVLPPRVACIQVVIVPCGISASLKNEDKLAIQSACTSLENELKENGVRVYGDYRENYSPGWRFNHWELKGVPIRIEYGPKDLAKQQIVAVRRDTGEKISYQRNSAVKDVLNLLEEIQLNLYTRAEKDLISHIVKSNEWDEFCKKLDEKNMILSPFCGAIECEEQIKKDSAREDIEAEAGAPAMGAKSLCNPFKQPAAISPSDKCINPGCRNKPQQYTLFGRSY